MAKEKLSSLTRKAEIREARPITLPWDSESGGGVLPQGARHGGLHGQFYQPVGYRPKTLISPQIVPALEPLQPPHAGTGDPQALCFFSR